MSDANGEWRPDSPIEMPDRTLRCKRHQSEICPICAVDYTYMRDLIADEEDEEDDEEYESDPENLGEEEGSQPGAVVFGADGERTVGQYYGIVSVPPSSHTPREDMPIENSIRPALSTIAPRPPIDTPTRKFTPPTPTATPAALFVPQSSFAHGPRFVRRTNYQDVLLYAAGACLPNGAAGCGVVWHPARPRANLRFRLELAGPDGVARTQTSSRAELRAAIAALGFRMWSGEGFARVVLAMDSEYVVLGITERLETWEQNDWRTAEGEPVENRDLWEVLRDSVKKFESRGAQPQFWLIPRELNTAADGLAKEAAAMTDPAPEYAQIMGVLVDHGGIF